MATADQKEDNPKYPTITRAELAGGYFNKHVAFVIKTPSGQEIKRRYTDFEWLRGLLRILYPGAFIPPIPPKLPVAMWPQGYLLMRKRELQQFLQRLEVIPYLKKEEVTSFFLTNHGGGFDKARKKWEKQHPRPSDKALFDKLVETFPKIHDTQTPQDMDKRCKQSTELIHESIKQLEIMVKSSEAFIDTTKECCDVMNEFQTAFDDLLRIESEGVVNKKYCTQKRVDISPHIESWKAYKMDEINNMNVYYIPTLNRALNDLKVIREILKTRDVLQSDYQTAKQRADVWLSNDTKAVRSSDLAKKHREVQREEDLRNLTGFVEKLVLGQLNVVFCANTRRWKKSCNLFASKHLLALEKVLGSWKNLTNKILKTKGDTDAIVKAVTVETIVDVDDKDDDDIKQQQQESSEQKRDKKFSTVDLDKEVDDVQVTSTVDKVDKVDENEEIPQQQQIEDDGGDKEKDDGDDEAEQQERLKKEQQEKEETERLEKEARERREKEEEAERLRKEKEENERLEAERKAKEEEEERLRKEKEEQERLEKEKKEKQEELKKSQEATKEKMKEMFKDENDKDNENEFPWDD